MNTAYAAKLKSWKYRRCALLFAALFLMLAFPAAARAESYTLILDRSEDCFTNAPEILKPGDVLDFSALGLDYDIESHSVLYIDGEEYVYVDFMYNSPEPYTSCTVKSYEEVAAAAQEEEGISMTLPEGQVFDHWECITSVGYSDDDEYAYYWFEYELTACYTEAGTETDDWEVDPPEPNAPGPVDSGTDTEPEEGPSFDIDPDSPITRAMGAEMLYELAGTPEAALSPFADVPGDADYAKAVGWGYANGLIEGTAPEYYRPERYITREEFAAILYRYVKALGLGFDVTKQPETDAEDADRISGFAYEAMCWMSSKGVFESYSDNTLRPGESISGQDAADMLGRLWKLL